MKKSNGSLLLVTSVALAAAFTGCADINPLKKMDDMNAGMKGMAADVSTTSANTDALTSNMNQGGSLGVRTEALKEMEKAEGVIAKAFAAKDFFLAFEFQIKPGIHGDPSRLDSLKDAGIREFFGALRQYVNILADLSSDPTSKDDNMENLYALAMTMHLVNDNSRMSSKTSILSMIEETLAIKNQLRSGSIAKKAYQENILKYERAATYMLQLRSNYSSVAALGTISNLGDGCGVCQLVKKLIHVKLGFDWTPRNMQENLTPELISEAADRLGEATRIHLFLKSIGKTPAPEKNVIDAYLQMEEIQTVSSSNEDAKYRNDAIVKLKTAIRVYVDTAQADLQ